MMHDMSILRVPGPTPIPPSVERAIAQPIIGHRSEEAKGLLHSVKTKLKPIFGTTDDVLLLTSSGTSGLEAAVVNTVSAGDEVLVIVTGAFGERFHKICTAYDLVVHRIDVEWGQAVDVNAVREVLKEHPAIKVVFSTFCETSTGVLNPVEEISNVVRAQTDALLVVDGVSCVGGVEAKMDEWGVDIFITGSQKAMMLPPGLCFIAVSERAWEVIEANKQPRFYLDLRKYRQSIEANAAPFTPAISLLLGLEQVLTLFEEEGLKQVFKRHEVMKAMMRGGIRALNIPLLTSEETASPTVTAVITEGFSAEALRKQMKNKFKLELAGGQQHLKDKIIRIGHMGYCSPADVLQMISLLEIGLVDLDVPIQLGSGVQAAQEIYMQMEAVE